MNRKHGILLGIALILLFKGIALATTLSPSTDVMIYALGPRIGFRLTGY
jgi:hypothetical protein